jgi:hypothetical protein
MVFLDRERQIMTQTKLIKTIISKIPKCAKNKNVIFATGNLAVAMGVSDYENVKIESLSDLQIFNLATLFGIKI